MDGGASRAYLLPLRLIPPMSPNHSQGVTGKVAPINCNVYALEQPQGFAAREPNSVCFDRSGKFAGRTSLVRSITRRRSATPKTVPSVL